MDLMNDVFIEEEIDADVPRFLHIDLDECFYRRQNEIDKTLLLYVLEVFSIKSGIFIRCVDLHNNSFILRVDSYEYYFYTDKTDKYTDDVFLKNIDVLRNRYFIKKIEIVQMFSLDPEEVDKKEFLKISVDTESLLKDAYDIYEFYSANKRDISDFLTGESLNEDLTLREDLIESGEEEEEEREEEEREQEEEKEEQEEEHIRYPYPYIGFYEFFAPEKRFLFDYNINIGDFIYVSEYSKILTNETETFSNHEISVDAKSIVKSNGIYQKPDIRVCYVECKEEAHVILFEGTYFVISDKSFENRNNIYFFSTGECRIYDIFMNILRIIKPDVVISFDMVKETYELYKYFLYINIKSVLVRLYDDSGDICYFSELILNKPVWVRSEKFETNPDLYVENIINATKVTKEISEKIDVINLLTNFLTHTSTPLELSKGIFNYKCIMNNMLYQACHHSGCIYTSRTPKLDPDPSAGGVANDAIERTIIPGVINDPIAHLQFDLLYPKIITMDNVCYTTRLKDGTFLNKDVRKGLIPQICETLLHKLDIITSEEGRESYLGMMIQKMLDKMQIFTVNYDQSFQEFFNKRSLELVGSVKTLLNDKGFSIVYEDIGAVMVDFNTESVSDTISTSSNFLAEFNSHESTKIPLVLKSIYCPLVIYRLRKYAANVINVDDKEKNNTIMKGFFKCNDIHLKIAFIKRFLIELLQNGRESAEIFYKRVQYLLNSRELSMYFVRRVHKITFTHYQRNSPIKTITDKLIRDGTYHSGIDKVTYVILDSPDKKSPKFQRAELASTAVKENQQYDIEDALCSIKKAVCDILQTKCESRRKQKDVPVFLRDLKDYEREYCIINSQCSRCIGSIFKRIKCDQVECPAYYRRTELEALLKNSNDMLQQRL